MSNQSYRSYLTYEFPKRMMARSFRGQHFQCSSDPLNIHTLHDRLLYITLCIFENILSVNFRLLKAPFNSIYFFLTQSMLKVKFLSFSVSLKISAHLGFFNRYYTCFHQIFKFSLKITS